MQGTMLYFMTLSARSILSFGMQNPLTLAGPCMWRCWTCGCASRAIACYRSDKGRGEVSRHDAWNIVTVKLPTFAAACAGALPLGERGDQPLAGRVLDAGHGRGAAQHAGARAALQPDHGARGERRPERRAGLLPLHAVRRRVLPQGAARLTEAVFGSLCAVLRVIMPFSTSTCLCLASTDGIPSGCVLRCLMSLCVWQTLFAGTSTSAYTNGKTESIV